MIVARNCEPLFRAIGGKFTETGSPKITRKFETRGPMHIHFKNLIVTGELDAAPTNGTETEQWKPFESFSDCRESGTPATLLAALEIIRSAGGSNWKKRY